jgi:curved DNA-binding protein CbpA
MAKKRSVNHYEVLGLAPHVSSDEIKQAYRKLVKSMHPDLSFQEKTKNQIKAETEQMMHINEAYATLMDDDKRAHYDLTIISRSRRQATVTTGPDSLDEEKIRERYLRMIFHPLRRAVDTILGKYKQKLAALAQDIWDEELLEAFGIYVEQIEHTLRKASNDLTENPPPITLKPAVQWMRHAIAQASDGLDELKLFMQNFDYDHLAMADNLFKIGREHLSKAAHACKSC